MNRPKQVDNIRGEREDAELEQGRENAQD